MTPRTLPALRAAVARVLVARGEAPDAVTVRSVALHGGRRAVAVEHPPGSWHLLAGRATGDTAADAIAAAWALVCLRCDEERDNATDAVDAAEARLRRARAACEAAGVGGGDYRDV